MRLGPLAGEACVALIREATDEQPLRPQAVEALVRRSGGSPRFLKALLFEVIRTGGSIGELPSSIEGVVTAQIDRLSPRARTRLRNLSVLGQSFTLEMAGRVLEDEVGLEADLVGYGAFEGFSSSPTAEADTGSATDPSEMWRTRAFRSAVGGSSTPGWARRSRPTRAMTRTTSPSSCRFTSSTPSGSRRRGGSRGCRATRRRRSSRMWRRATSSYGRWKAALRLSGLDGREIAGASEALGDVRMRLGEYREAERAYRDARRHVDGDGVSQARLLLKEALVLDVEGRYPQALRTLTRGTGLLADGEPGSIGLRARLAAHYAGICWAQGRNDEAVTWARLRDDDGEATGELDATAHALYVLDIAEHSLGLSPGGPYSKQALDLYERLSNLAEQGDVMNNLGYYAYFQGNWHDAVSWYERARDVFLRTGNVVDAAIDEMNIGEVLLFQGRLEEAAKQLRDALRIFRASGVRPPELFAATLPRSHCLSEWSVRNGGSDVRGCRGTRS